MKLRELWRRMVSARYSAHLESEVGRLRAENRALLNSILGIAGVPPITVGADDPAPAMNARPAVAAETAKKSVGAGVVSTRAGGQAQANAAAPTRRRSWHQVYRMLEIDSARKKEAV